MIDPFELYKTFRSDVNTFQGGFVRPESDFIEQVNNISFALWDNYTSQAEKTQEINDNLAPFLKSRNMIVGQSTGNYGIAPYPEDYGRYSVARVLQHGEECLCEIGKDTYDHSCKKIETPLEKDARNEKYKDGITEVLATKVESSKWASMLEHRTKCPTFKSPGITQYDKGFKVAPRQVSVIVLDYYILPQKATFVYTVAPGNPQTGAGDYIIYDAKKSVKLEWPQSMIPVFIKELRDVYARFTRDGQLFQMNKP